MAEFNSFERWGSEGDGKFSGPGKPRLGGKIPRTNKDKETMALFALILCHVLAPLVLVESHGLSSLSHGEHSDL